MTDHHRRLIGLPGQPHTGVESRALRSTLNLERRHVVALANAIGLYADDVTTSQVTSWERGKPGGYPEALTTALETIASAVRWMAGGLVEEAMVNAGLIDEGFLEGEDALRRILYERWGTALQLRRPLGAKRVLMLLDLGAHDLVLDHHALDVLDQGGGDFWQALADAAISRALIICEAGGSSVQVVLDREVV